jgi:hypothetical protein
MFVLCFASLLVFNIIHLNSQLFLRKISRVICGLMKFFDGWNVNSPTIHS